MNARTTERRPASAAARFVKSRVSLSTRGQTCDVLSLDAALVLAPRGSDSPRTVATQEDPVRLTEHSRGSARCRSAPSRAGVRRRALREPVSSGSAGARPPRRACSSLRRRRTSQRSSPAWLRPAPCAAAPRRHVRPDRRVRADPDREMSLPAASSNCAHLSCVLGVVAEPAAERRRLPTAAAGRLIVCFPIVACASSRPGRSPRRVVPARFFGPVDLAENQPFGKAYEAAPNSPATFVQPGTAPLASTAMIPRPPSAPRFLIRFLPQIAQAVVPAVAVAVARMVAAPSSPAARLAASDRLFLLVWFIVTSD